MVVLSSQVPVAVGRFDLTRALPARMVQGMNLPSWIIVTLCLITQSQLPASADDAVVEKQRIYLLTGMRAEREKLRSGQVVMSGEHWSNTTVSLGMMRFSVRFDVYFDHDTKSYRYTQRDYLPQGTLGMDPRWKTSLLARSELPRGTTSEGVVLRHLEERTRPPRALPHTRRGPPMPLRIHRSLLQPTTQPLRPERHLTIPIRRSPVIPFPRPRSVGKSKHREVIVSQVLGDC